MTNVQEVIKQSIYHIRVGGELDEKWADWFEGFAMAAREKGVTLLSGPVADQAALHGVLDKIHSLGLPLLLVARTDCPCPKVNCPRRGRCSDCAAHYMANKREPFCFRARTKWDKRCVALTEVTKVVL